MRLLVDCTPLHSGGGVQVAIAFLENLRQWEEMSWHAVVPEPMRSVLPAMLRSDSRVTFVAKSGVFHLLNIRSQLNQWEQMFNPDVVFTIFGPSYFRATVPHLVGFAIPHLIYEPYAKMPLKKRVRHALLDHWRCRQLRRADHLVVETETVRRRLARKLGIASERISVIGNSLNPLLARHNPNQHIPVGKYVLLICSAYYPHKNLEIVPAVAQALAQLAPDLDFEFRFTLDAAGAPWRNLASQANQLGVGHRLTTLGTLSLDTLADAYKSASAVFLPTLREASTAVYPESFYFERPLITSDIDFAHELCDEAAVYVPPFDPEAIAVRIKELVNSPQLAERLVQTGKKRLAETYPAPQAKFKMQLDLLGKVAGFCATPGA